MRLRGLPDEGFDSSSGDEHSVSRTERRAMMVTRKHLPRRAFLRGAGAALALPFLDAMVPAFGGTTNAAASPVRMGFVYVPNGIIESSWKPAGDGPAFEFNSTMKALAPYRDRTLVLS